MIFLIGMINFAALDFIGSKPGVISFLNIASFILVTFFIVHNLKFLIKIPRILKEMKPTHPDSKDYSLTIDDLSLFGRFNLKTCLKWKSLAHDCISMIEKLKIDDENYELLISSELSGINAKAVGLKGLGPRIIYFSKDAVETLSLPSLRALMAHELSHFYLNHPFEMLKMKTTSSLFTVLFSTLGLIAALLGPNSFFDTINVVCVLVVLAQIFLMAWTNRKSRQFEYDADRLSTTVVPKEDLIDILLRLDSDEEKGRTKTERIVSKIASCGSHPSLRNRANALQCMN